MKMGSQWVVAVMLAGLGLGGLSSQAWALPVMNLNAPGAELLTVFPDHQDKNLYYLAPAVMTVAQDDRGLPFFSYIEFLDGFVTHAIVQATLRPAYRSDAVNATKESILKSNPNAKFTSIPYSNSKLVFSDALKPLVEQSYCTHIAASVGEEQSCSFEFNSRGRKVLRSMFREGLTISMQLEYSIEGVVQKEDGSYSSKSNLYSIAARLGGGDLKKFPELFRDRNGRPIVWDDDKANEDEEE